MHFNLSFGIKNIIEKYQPESEIHLKDLLKNPINPIIYVTFSSYLSLFSEKRKNSHKMGPKPRNYLKITKNIENNAKLINKEIEIEFGHVDDVMTQKGAIIVQLLLFWLPYYTSLTLHLINANSINSR